jgi:site-specific recombinase XerD
MMSRRDSFRPRPVHRPLPNLSEVSIKRLINAANSERDRAIFEMFYATGCRVSELVNIHLSNVDFAKRTIRILWKGQERRVLFGAPAKKAILAYLGGRPTATFSRLDPKYKSFGIEGHNLLGWILGRLRR